MDDAFPVETCFIGDTVTSFETCFSSYILTSSPCSTSETFIDIDMELCKEKVHLLDFVRRVTVSNKDE